jgi:hypothetical protein
MFPIFHIAVPLILFELPLVKKRFEFNRFALIIGSLFPDIIDKFLLFTNLGSGRGISHTILFIIISFVILHFITKGRKSISIPFLLGMIVHLILDLPEVPLFYPFIMYEFIIIEDPLGLWLYTLFNNPVVYLTEIAGILIIIFVLLNNKLYNIKEITNYLKRNVNLEPQK